MSNRENNSSLKPYKILSTLLIIACAFSLVSRWIMIDRMPFVMDELVDIQLAGQIDKGVKIYSELDWIRTPLMNYLICATVAGWKDSFLSVVQARKIMWIGTFLVFLLTYVIARKIYGHYHALISSFMLAGFTTFLERSIRVRADLISTLFSLPALYFLISSNLKSVYMIVAGFFLCLSVLATQKAAYYIIAFFVSLLIRDIFLLGFNKKLFERLFLDIAFFCVGFAVPLSVFFFWLHMTDQLNDFVSNGLIHAAQAGVSNDTYREVTKRYVFQTIFRNPVFWLLGLAGIFGQIILALKSKLLSNQFSNNGEIAPISVSVWTFTILLLILHHNAKFPYLYLNIAPGLAICASFSFLDLLSSFKKSTGAARYLYSVGAIFAFYFLVINPVYFHYKNLKINVITKNQIKIMSRVDKLTNTEDSVFDGIGIAVSRNKATRYSLTARWANERSNGADYDIIDALRESEPKVWIDNYRMVHLNEDEKQFLSSSFVRDWANVYVAGATISHRGPGLTEKRVNLISSATYAVLADDRLKVRIDGRVPSASMYMDAGMHDVSIVGESQELVLKYQPAADNELPPEEPFPLFPSYSE